LKKAIEILPLPILIIISTLLLSGRIRFGLGLGDWFFHILTYSITIIYCGYFLIKAKAPKAVRIVMSISAFTFSIYLIFLMTIGRGPEYGWGGNILVTSKIEEKKSIPNGFENTFSKTAKESNLKNGDIIFQISKSSQSKAIQLATNSKYSHMGIIYEIDGDFIVYEAIQPVQITPLNDWIKRGENAHYVVKRLINSDEVLSEITIKKMIEYGKQFEGKPYDIHFEWSDDKMYCSELVWKIYKNSTNTEIGKLQKLSEFNLTVLYDFVWVDLKSMVLIELNDC
jgi:uncharacterized protein YycO